MNTLEKQLLLLREEGTIATILVRATGEFVNDVSQALQTMLGSRRVSTYVDRGEEYRVIVQADREGLSTTTDLSR